MFRKKIMGVMLALSGLLMCNANAAVAPIAINAIPDQGSLRKLHPADLPPTRFSSLPISQAIKTVRGNGARRLAVFSDPDCPYCRKLERDTLSQIDNVTIYTFLFPLDQHVDAARKAALIWCARDQSRAWESWMLEDRLPGTTAACALPIAANLSLAQSLGIRATPTMMLESGTEIIGMVSKDALEGKLNSDRFKVSR